MTQKPHVWPSLRYEDPVAAMKFLSDALGFVKVVDYQNEDGVIEHAQMSWPNGGGIMLGQAREDSAIAELTAGLVPSVSSPQIPTNCSCEPSPRGPRSLWSSPTKSTDLGLYYSRP